MTFLADRRPLLSFAAAAVILTVVGVLVVLTAIRFLADSRLVTHTSAVLTEVDDIAALAETAIAVQRGYLLSGDRSLRIQFLELKAEIPHRVRNLNSMVQYKPVAERLAKLELKLRRRLTLAANTVDAYDRDGLLAAQAHIRSNGSIALDRELEALFANIRDQETDLLAARRLDYEKSADWLLIAAFGGIPLSLLMLVVVYRVLVRENAHRRKSEQLATQAKKVSGDMEALSSYASMLQTCEAIHELLAVTRQVFLTLVPDLAGTIYLIRASRDHAEAALQWGTHAASSNVLPVPSDCWSVRRNQPFCCHDVHSGITCPHVERSAGNVTAATACLPLSAQGELMGWLYLSGPGPGPLRGFGLALQAAEQFSLALANVRLHDELKSQSIRDPLTGLFNRRYLEESLTREISRCQRRKLSLVVLMFDLDNFKSFNDHYGHPGGDALLSAFGRLLQAHCRPEDIACRYGGEEFTLILPEAELDLGLQRAREIMSATAHLVVAHQGAPLGRVTTSIGLAMMPEHGTTGPALLEAADKALYQAKLEGRNRVCAAGLGSAVRRFDHMPDPSVDS